MSVSDITRMGNNQLDAIREELKNTQLNNSTDTEQLSDVNQISEKESIEGLLILDEFSVNKIWLYLFTKPSFSKSVST